MKESTPLATNIARVYLFNTMPHHIIQHPALAPLKAKFPETKFLAGEMRGMITLVVPREMILKVCRFLRDEPTLRYDMLCDVNSVDYLNYPGATHRFAVNYGLTSIPHNNRLWLKVFLDPTMTTAPKTAPRDEEVMEKGDPGLKIDSVTGIWPGAEWMEREVYDMMGIIFVGHLQPCNLHAGCSTVMADFVKRTGIPIDYRAAYSDDRTTQHDFDPEEGRINQADRKTWKKNN